MAREAPKVTPSKCKRLSSTSGVKKASIKQEYIKKEVIKQEYRMMMNLTWRRSTSSQKQMINRLQCPPLLPANAPKLLQKHRPNLPLKSPPNQPPRKRKQQRRDNGNPTGISGSSIRSGTRTAPTIARRRVLWTFIALTVNTFSLRQFRSITDSCPIAKNFYRLTTDELDTVPYCEFVNDYNPRHTGRAYPHDAVKTLVCQKFGMLTGLHEQWSITSDTLIRQCKRLFEEE